MSRLGFIARKQTKHRKKAMLNILTIPAKKSYPFIIPKSAKVDAKGFYIIDDDFKAENGHIDFNYLAHDLEHRGLHVDDSFYDRNDYMKKGLIDHHDYFLQFINKNSMERALFSFFGRETIEQSKDEHFNDIPLKEWDQFNARAHINGLKFGFAECASYVDRNKLWSEQRVPWSMSNNVCFAKTMAHIIRDKAQM